MNEILVNKSAFHEEKKGVKAFDWTYIHDIFQSCQGSSRLLDHSPLPAYRPSLGEFGPKAQLPTLLCQGTKNYTVKNILLSILYLHTLYTLI